MNCRQGRDWLLAARADEPHPAPVRRHLEACPGCAAWRQRLGLLDDAVRRLPPPPSDPSVKAGLAARLAPRHAPLRGRRPQAGRMLAFAAAAVILLALGWLVGRRGGAPSVPSVPNAPAPEVVSRPPPTEPESPLVARVLDHDLRLAHVRDPAERLDALTALAGDLRAEALRLARRGSADELSLVVNLYGRVLRQGLAGRARTLPEAERGRLPGLARRLEADGAGVEREAGELLPAVGDLLRPMAVAARETAGLIRAGRASAESEPAAGPEATPRLLAVLVADGLRLAEQDDPLGRAAACADLSDALVRTTVLLAAAGDEERASALGRRLGEVLDQGVADNLERAAPEADPAAVERVRSKAARAVASLERNLAHAPPAARAGLRRALEASGPAGERAVRAGKSKHRGPKGKSDHPKGKDGPKGKGFGPPGQNKKRQSIAPETLNVPPHAVGADH